MIKIVNLFLMIALCQFIIAQSPVISGPSVICPSGAIYTHTT